MRSHRTSYRALGESVDAGSEEHLKTGAPQDEASLFSKLTFGWMSPLLRTGSRRPLMHSDLGELSHADTAHVVNSEFERHWAAEPVKDSKGLTHALWKAFGWCVGGG